MKLAWNMETTAVTSDTVYNITVWTTKFNNNDTLSWTTNDTELVLETMQPNVEYSWFVEVNNCIDQNKSVIETFQLIVKGIMYYSILQ